MNSTSFPVFANVPALVSHQPTLPRDEPTARGRRTCLASRVPDQRLAVLCGEAKTSPLGVDREEPARSWDGLELPKADALGVVIGQSCRRPFDRPYNLQMRCWGRWAWVSAEQVIWGSVWSIMFFSPFRGAHGELFTTAPDRESSSAYTSYFRQGSWLTVTMHFLTVHPGGHESLTLAWRGCSYLGLLLSNRAHARICNGNVVTTSYSLRIYAQ